MLLRLSLQMLEKELRVEFGAAVRQMIEPVA